MKTRPDDPRHLDVEGFAKGAVALQGETALHALPRLAGMAHAGAAAAGHLPDGTVSWRAHGESRAVRGGAPHLWLHLEADTALSLVCQRCLDPVAVPVRAQRSFRFVPGEEAAAQLDAEIDDELPVDVLALPHALDLHELIEDELLLALPLVPRHEICPEPLLPPPDVKALDEPAHPFAALQVLKHGTPPN